MTWKSHVSGMRDDLHPFLPFATPVATIRTTPTFVKHSAKALRNKYSLPLLLSPLLLRRRHVHPVLPTWRATNQTDKRLWPWSEPPATTTIRHQEQKRKNSQQFQTKIYPHTGTLAHPVNCLSPCSVRTQRPQLQWQIVRRFSFWHAKSLITSVCSQRVFPENHWKTAEDNTWISAHRTRSRTRTVGI